jgi:hypothetical protein
MGEIQFGLNLSDALELNVEGRTEVRDLLGDVLLKAIGPTTNVSMIDSEFRRHGAL